jgi:hypothetical protein
MNDDDYILLTRVLRMVVEYIQSQYKGTYIERYLLDTLQRLIAYLREYQATGHTPGTQVDVPKNVPFISVGFDDNEQ